MKCPILQRTLLISDDARLAAQVSCVFAQPGAYLPVVDGPRLTRPDRDAEVVRRNNVAARARSNRVLLAGLSDESRAAIANRFNPRLRPTFQRIETIEDAYAIDGAQPSVPPVMWGRDRVGIGLLKALRARTNIVFSDDPSPVEHVDPKSDHLVVCEDGDALAQVIAANYAFSLGAGLQLIPEVDEQTSEQILENFYNLYDQQQSSPTAVLEALKAQLRNLCEPIALPPHGSLTFITGRLPYGFGYSEMPSTHLFKYPDLGIAVVNGFAAEQENARGVGVAVLVDPGKTEAPEIEAAEKLLPARGIFLRCYRDRGANVRAVTEMVDLYPYDLLILATHCGDASGYRWTYEFTDSEGIDRKLVVDIAVGFAPTGDRDMIGVTQFMRFVSLDGVDWHDPQKKEKLYVGRAMLDFMERANTKAENELKPVKKEDVPRVVGSAVLQMHDHNYIPLPRPIADAGTAIMINNACCSWHRLAETFTFCNARAYVGTLFQVSTTEAHDVVVKLLEKHFGKPLAGALWSSQREVYGEGVRRPYIITGIYPQRLRVSRQDAPRYLASRFVRSRDAWKTELRERSTQSDERLVKRAEEAVAFYERELTGIRRNWLER